MVLRDASASKKKDDKVFNSNYQIFVSNYFEIINTGLLCVLCKRSKMILRTRQLWMDKVVRYCSGTGRFFTDVLFLEVFGTVK